ncbi:hypothetical protein [Anaerococcus sp.]|uniref:hypothetical protein n=1 Tax=Anaerococcus sp. TaxID=1872515 RepID=UPI0029038303|nr:hypothetical protein [Anaerococcus sp.]MDU3212359.1 hypothetical protein [Anaerococcus sp.]
MINNQGLKLYKKYPIYNETTCFILNMAADRVIKLKNISNKTNEEICTVNKSYLSKVLNKTIKEKNRYLFTDNVLYGIKSSFNFRSYAEIIFGNKKEQRLYGGELFYHLITDILSLNYKNYKDKIELVRSTLMEYYEYAIACFLKDLEFSDEFNNPIIYKILNENEFKRVIIKPDEYEIALRYSTAYTYKNIEEEFLDIFYNFSKKFEEDGTKKIFEKFDLLIDNLSNLFLEQINSSISGTNLYDVLYFDSLKIKDMDTNKQDTKYQNIKSNIKLNLNFLYDKSKLQHKYIDKVIKNECTEYNYMQYMFDILKSKWCIDKWDKKSIDS